MAKTESKTEKDTNLVERITGSHHYKTTITDGRDKVEREGRTSKESEDRASKSWWEK
jgi:hypothetical protein